MSIYLSIHTTGFGAGTDTTEHHGGATTGHHRHQSGNDTKASMKDKIIGGVEKVAGKMTSNTEMYQRGEERAVSLFSTFVCCSNFFKKYQGQYQGR